MLTVRKSAERGFFDHGWLKTNHTFSFASYHNRQQMHFQALRVINEDIIQTDRGFGQHAHDNMEIITYIIAGELKHQDSMGNSSIIRAGDLQRMSAGAGLEHSEFNPSPSTAVHLLQIWIMPAVRGGEPTYEQKHFSTKDKFNQLRLMVTPDGAAETITIGQDVKIYSSILEPEKSLDFRPSTDRHQWLQLITGELLVNDITLTTGDGLAISNETELTMRATERAEFLLFDLASYR